MYVGPQDFFNTSSGDCYGYNERQKDYMRRNGPPSNSINQEFQAKDTSKQIITSHVFRRNHYGHRVEYPIRHAPEPQYLDRDLDDAPRVYIPALGLADTLREGKATEAKLTQVKSRGFEAETSTRPGQQNNTTKVNSGFPARLQKSNYNAREGLSDAGAFTPKPYNPYSPDNIGIYKSVQEKQNNNSTTDSYFDD